MWRRWLAGVALAAALDAGASVAATPVGDRVFEAHSPGGGDTALERTTPIEWVRLRSLGGAGGSSYLEFSGARSPVRFKAAEPIEFTVHETSLSGDAAASLRLYALDPKGEARQLDLVERATGPDAWKALPSHTLALTAHPLAGDLARLVPNARLAPGEYCLGGPRVHEGFCFGVDP